jgi:hypothetical protein
VSLAFASPSAVGVTLSLLLLPGIAAASGDYAGDLSSIDKHELLSLERTQPNGVGLWRQGEEALRTGDLSRAEGLFRASRQGVPQFGLAARRHCQVLSELGRRDEAIAACSEAVTLNSTGRDLRAAVGALMSGTTTPTTEDFASAATIAGGIIKGNVAGFAALYDIGWRLGDRAMMNSALENLRRLAPDHFETKRAEAELPASRPWRFWLGWILAALAGLGTLWHAALRGRPARVASASGPERPLAAALPLICLGALLLSASSAHAAAPAAGDFPKTAESFEINDDDPSSNIPSEKARNEKPLEFGYWLQELLERGQKALKDHDPPRAAKYFLAIAKGVPTKATGFGKVCEAYEAGGERAKAIAACNEAMARQGARLEDSVRYVRLVLQKDAAPTTAELKDIQGVLDHLRASDDVSALTANQMQCDLALRLSDTKMLASCTAALVKMAPQNARTVAFQWALAVRKGDGDLARRLLAEGKKAGIDANGLHEMELTTAQIGPGWQGLLTNWRGLAMLACLGGAAAFLLRYFSLRRRSTLRPS